MGLEEIRRLATALGIKGAEKMDVRDLIHSVQFQEGHMPCFSETWSTPCMIEDCPFAEVCRSYLRSRTAAH